MATPISSYAAQAGNVLPAPVYSSAPQAKWPIQNYNVPYGFASPPQSHFGPQASFSPGYSPYAFNTPPQYFQQPYPQALQPIIQYVPVIRQPPAKPKESASPALTQPITPTPLQPTVTSQPETIPLPFKKEKAEAETQTPQKTAEPPEREEAKPSQEAKTRLKPLEKSPGLQTKPKPADFAEETGERVGAWITGFLKEHPEWENKIKQFDLPNHLDTLGQGLATGQMPNLLENVRGQFNQSWLLRHALPWLEKPLLAMSPFEYRIPLTQFFKWLKQKPDKA